MQRFQIEKQKQTYFKVEQVLMIHELKNLMGVDGSLQLAEKFFDHLLLIGKIHLSPNWGYMFDDEFDFDLTFDDWLDSRN